MKREVDELNTDLVTRILHVAVDINRTLEPIGQLFLERIQEAHNDGIDILRILVKEKWEDTGKRVDRMIDMEVFLSMYPAAAAFSIVDTIRRAWAEGATTYRFKVVGPGYWAWADPKPKPEEKP